MTTFVYVLVPTVTKGIVNIWLFVSNVSACAVMVFVVKIVNAKVILVKKDFILSSFLRLFCWRFYFWVV